MTTQPETIERRVKRGTPKCGFCMTGFHETCSSGVRNGDGTITRCSCKDCDRAKERRCTDCNNRRQEEVGEDWYCIDRQACREEIDRRLDSDPIMRKIRESTARAREEDRLRRAQRAAERADAMNDPNDPLYEVLNAPDISKPTARVSRGTPKPTSGECLCCGEPTRGGKFLPGHDSKLLTQYAERVVAGELSKADAVGECMKISQALAKKAQVRIDRALLRAAVK